MRHLVDLARGVKPVEWDNVLESMWVTTMLGMTVANFVGALYTSGVLK